MSTVIKAGQSARVLPNLSRVDLADHMAEARSIVEQARREAAQLAAEARAQAEVLREEARRAGYEAGLPQGLEEGRRRGHDEAFRAAAEEFAAKQTSLVEALTRALAEVETIKRTIQLEAERDVLQYAVDLATKLTLDIGRTHSDAAVENLRRALRTVGSTTDLTIRINPGDIASIETFCGRELELPAAASHVRVLTDEAIAPGGCHVESGRCEVDATLETQTAQLVALVLGENHRGQRPSGE